jgi:hypothetical protein
MFMSGEDVVMVVLLACLLRGAVAYVLDVRWMVRQWRVRRRWGRWGGRA